jgi:methionyl-tRNA synthetase
MVEELNSACDEYIDKSAPWKLAKQPEAQPQLHTVLNTSARALRLLAILLYPFMPTAAQQMIHQLGLSLDLSQPVSDEEQQLGQNSSRQPDPERRLAVPPHRIQTTRSQTRERDTCIPAQPSPVTPSPAAAQSSAPPVAAPAAAQPAQITIDDFMKIQLKAAKVLAAERVPKSEKLLKLQVSLGSEQRQIVAGIGKKYEPETLIGKTIVIVANLKPAKLMGIESQGMVLAAGDSEVRGLATFIEDVEPGTKVK